MLWGLLLNYELLSRSKKILVDGLLILLNRQRIRLVVAMKLLSVLTILYRVIIY